MRSRKEIEMGVLCFFPGAGWVFGSAWLTSRVFVLLTEQDVAASTSIARNYKADGDSIKIISDLSTDLLTRGPF